MGSHKWKKISQISTFTTESWLKKINIATPISISELQLVYKMAGVKRKNVNVVDAKKNRVV